MIEFLLLLLLLLLLLHTAELRHVLHNLGDPLSTDEVESIIREAQVCQKSPTSPINEPYIDLKRDLRALWLRSGMLRSALPHP